MGCPGNGPQARMGLPPVFLGRHLRNRHTTSRREADVFGITQCRRQRCSSETGSGQIELATQTCPSFISAGFGQILANLGQLSDRLHNIRSGTAKPIQTPSVSSQPPPYACPRRVRTYQRAASPHAPPDRTRLRHVYVGRQESLHNGGCGGGARAAAIRSAPWRP